MSRSTRPAPPGPLRPAIDPAIPAAARQLLAAAPDGALTPASSPAPARAHGRLGEATGVMAPGLLVTAVFAAAGAGMPVILPSFFNFLFGPPPRGQAAGLAGLVAASQVVFFLIAVVTAGFSVLLTMTLLSPARAGGADTPTRKAARAYHSRYITPDDLDGPAAALLARAQHAIATITATALCRDGLLDDPPDSPDLAQHEWDIAQALADLTRLRRQQDPPPGRAEQRARRDTEATITTRVRALEAYAAETASAETAYRAWQAAAQPELSDAALDLLAAAPAHQQATTSIAARTQRAAAARLALTELTSTPGTASTPSPPGGRPLRAAALAGVRAARHLRTALGGGTSSPGQPAGCCDTSACTCQRCRTTTDGLSRPPPSTRRRHHPAHHIEGQPVVTKPAVTELTDTFFELFAYSDITWDGQSADWQAEEQLSSITNLRVRYRIHHDLSYSRQSHATAQVWSTTTMSWNEIASYPAGLWTHAADWTGTGGRPTKPGATGHPTYGMVEAMMMLRQRAGDVLAVL